MAPTRELSIEIRGILLDLCYAEKTRRNKVLPARTESETIAARNMKRCDDRAPFESACVLGILKVIGLYRILDCLSNACGHDVRLL